MDSEMATFAYYGFAFASFFFPHQLESNVLNNEKMDDEEILDCFLQNAWWHWVGCCQSF